MNTEIVLNNNPNSSYSVKLDGVLVEITLKWNFVPEAVGFWTFSIYSIGTGRSCNGRRIKSGVSIMPLNTGVIDGNFAAISTYSPEADLGLEPWNDTHKLVYLGV